MGEAFSIEKVLLAKGLDTLVSGGRPQVKFSVSDAMMGAPTRVGRAVGVATGTWVWLQGRGHGCRGGAAGPWARLQGRGRGCSEAAGPWARLQGRGRGCRAMGEAAGPWAWLQGCGRGCRAVGMASLGHEVDVNSSVVSRASPIRERVVINFGIWREGEGLHKSGCYSELPSCRSGRDAVRRPPAGRTCGQLATR